MREVIAKLSMMLAGVLLCAAAGAQGARPAEADGPSWSSLTPSQRQALAPLERDWAHADAASKQKWLEMAARFPRMQAEERARVQERMALWSRMTAQQRNQARLQFREAQRLSPQEREARWQAYQALPPERKEELKRRAASPSSRRAGAREVAPKSNVVPDPSEQVRARPVGPSVIRVGPGATTRLVTEPPAPPRHQQTGLPKITATPTFVDSQTLLPKRGPQAAATREAPRPPRRRDR